MSNTKDWISAFRLRTLPLALSSIFMGSFVALFHGLFRWEVLVLSAVTTLFLQILSNLANDYGDYKSGADSDQREGPERMVQSGRIGANAMKRMIMAFGILAFLSGLLLLFIAFNGAITITFLVFILLGVLAIAAAIKYTVGKNPYGYRGLGDWYVFLFFGLLGVMGTYYLHALRFDWMVLLPAASIGFLSSGVLNVNNMRDEKNDGLSGKRTLVVMIGGQKARIYHLALIALSQICLLAFTFLNYKSGWQLLFLLTLPILFVHLRVIQNNYEHDAIDPELKRLALTTFFTVLLMGLGLLLSL